MRNIFINIGLTIFSGIIYLFCVKLFNNLYADREPSLFSGIIIMLEIWFFNISGIISSSMNIKKIKSILIIYGLFIVLTISIYNLTNIIMPMFQNFWLIIAIGIIIIENIFSYLIVKIIITDVTRG
jgi:hypothetical protein